MDYHGGCTANGEPACETHTDSDSYGHVVGMLLYFATRSNIAMMNSQPEAGTPKKRDEYAMGYVV